MAVPSGLVVLGASSASPSGFFSVIAAIRIRRAEATHALVSSELWGRLTFRPFRGPKGLGMRVHVRYRRSTCQCQSRAGSPTEYRIRYGNTLYSRNPITRSIVTASNLPASGDRYGWARQVLIAAGGRAGVVIG